MGIKTSTTFDLNIIICGKPTYQQVSLLFGEGEKPLDEEYHEIKGKNYKIKHNKILDWKYFIMPNGFNDEIINTINDIIIDSYDLYQRKNLIIGFLTKNETIKLLKSFNKHHENYYPFFIIIPNNQIENKNEENDFNIININTEFDENFNIENLLKTNDIKINNQNIFIHNWSENPENNPIISTMIKICSYYNELGDSFNFPKNCGFNIENNNNINFTENYKNFITVGGTGVGKSTFINLFLQEKKSLCGEGFSQTSKIVKYIHKSLPVFIYDTPGFTLGKNDEVKITLEAIKTLISDLNTKKKNIDIIFYLVNSQSGRTLQGIEFEILKYFVKIPKIKIFFVLTRVYNKIQGEQFKIEFENSLNVLFKDDKNVIVQHLVENVYLVDLKNEKTCEKLLKNINEVVFDNNTNNNDYNNYLKTPFPINKDNNIKNDNNDNNNNNNEKKEKNKVLQIIEKIFK